MKTQDLGQILRKAKEDFEEDDEAPFKPYKGDDVVDEPEDCQVEETDPEEMSYPKHEPA